MNCPHTKRSWLEISLEQIKKNYTIYKYYITNDVMAVVKADAYGHGDVKVTKVMQECGVKSFAVSNIKPLGFPYRSQEA